MLFFCLALSLLTSVLYALKLRQAIEQAPTLHRMTSGENLPSLTVIIPAYNEAVNIEDCVCSVLHDASFSQVMEIWVVDDQSTDETWTILQRLQDRLKDARLRLLAGQPRPAGEVWLGKNWACTQAAAQASGDYLLFLDADLRLHSGAIATALHQAQQETIDLLTICPTVVCGCMAEWLAQPLIILTMLIGFNFKAVNDPTTDNAFGAGMFMLFRRESYEKIGGHTAVAAQVVEDVELARLLKSSGLKLQCAIGSELASVRMYRSWAALWEGWTKNLYSGGQRNPVSMAKFVLVMLLLCVVPWVGLGVALVQQNWLAIIPILLIFTLHYTIRRIGATASGIAPRYWWLMGCGGLFVVAIGLTSVLKTETGWGWTWRGRSLSQS